jgi:hypothetical protein
MNSAFEEFSLRRPRVLTLVVVLIVAVGITLANLSAKPVTDDDIGKMYQGVNVERAYGWPFTWYWRSAVQVRDTTGPGMTSSVARLQWPISRYSAPAVLADLATWLVMLGVSVVACRRLLSRYQPRLSWRPTVSTVIVLIFVVGLTALANLSFDVNSPPFGVSYGWPLIWYRHAFLTSNQGHWTPFFGWDFSTARLAANLVIWLLVLIFSALAWQWLRDRYRPKLRWSLRTMLIAVGLLGGLFAWFAGARKRAHEQDAVIARVQAGNGTVYVERWGPKWLDLIGADPLRRRIVGAHLTINDGTEQDEELFRRLARLPGVEYLDLTCDTFTPHIAAALGDMQRLHTLGIDYRYDDEEALEGASRDCLAAIAKLTQLERLGLFGSLQLDEQNIEHLRGLANLKTLALGVYYVADMPVLPRLESLYLGDAAGFTDDDLDRVALLPRLRSLSVEWTAVGDAGLVKLAPLETLEELTISDDVATTTGLETLLSQRHLRAIHIINSAFGKTDRTASLVLDNGRKMAVLPSELDGMRRALQALRQAHPGIVIDAVDPFLDANDFNTRTRKFEIPWDFRDTPDRLTPYLRQIIWGSSP